MHQSAKRSTALPATGWSSVNVQSTQYVERSARSLAQIYSTFLFRAVLENIFRFDGKPGHEIVFVFEARFVDATLYEQDEILGLEGDERFVAKWVPLAHFEQRGPPLYPQVLLELLRAPDGAPVI